MRISSSRFLSVSQRKMFEQLHKYYCVHCQIYIVGETIERLCYGLNDHNYEKHSATESAQWSTLGLVCSSQYEPPDETTTALAIRPRSEYTTPRGTKWNSEWGTAATPPNITPDDIAMLAEGRVKW